MPIVLPRASFYNALAAKMRQLPMLLPHATSLLARQEVFILDQQVRRVVDQNKIDDVISSERADHLELLAAGEAYTFDDIYPALFSLNAAAERGKIIGISQDPIQDFKIREKQLPTLFLPSEHWTGPLRETATSFIEHLHIDPMPLEDEEGWSQLFIAVDTEIERRLFAGKVVFTKLPKDVTQQVAPLARAIVGCSFMINFAEIAESLLKFLSLSGQDANRCVLDEELLTSNIRQLGWFQKDPYDEQALYCLENAGINTLSDLLKQSLSDLENIDGISLWRIDRIVRRLGEQGIYVFSTPKTQPWSKAQLDRPVSSLNIDNRLKNYLLQRQIYKLTDLGRSSLYDRFGMEMADRFTIAMLGKGWGYSTGGGWSLNLYTEYSSPIGSL